jgi:hypothetical protein
VSDRSPTPEELVGTENRSSIFSAASRTVQLSIAATKSKTFPRFLQLAAKHWKQFFTTLT